VTVSEDTSITVDAGRLLEWYEQMALIRQTEKAAVEEAREMAKDLIIGYLEALAKDGTPAPVEDLEPLTEPVREVLEIAVD
jgi:hypothetical protein